MSEDIDPGNLQLEIYVHLDRPLAQLQASQLRSQVARFLQTKLGRRPFDVLLSFQTFNNLTIYKEINDGNQPG